MVSSQRPNRMPSVSRAWPAGVLSVGLLVFSSRVQAADLPDACQEGFIAMAETADAVVCRWEGHADTEMAAERVSRHWARRATCEVAIEGPQTSISQVDTQDWLVVVRYACGN